MVSEEIRHVMGNEFTVYGFKEYEEFRNGKPVKIIIAIHDIGKDRQSLRDLCMSLCKDDVLVITFDIINHGVRRLPEINPADFFKNSNFNLDIWSYSQEATNVISLLLGAGQDRLFYPLGSYPVKSWTLLGQGLGAVSCITAAMQEPRVSTVITIDSTFEVLDWMELLVKEHNHDMNSALSDNLKVLIHSYLKDKEMKLQNTNILMINNITSSPLNALNDAFLNRMFEIRQEIRSSCVGSKWKMIIRNQTNQKDSILSADIINSWIESDLVKH